MEPKEIKSVLECLLFVSDKPLPLASMKAILDPVDRRTLLECLDELKAEYDAQGRAFHLTEIAEGYQLATRISYAPWIRKLYKSKVANRLSRAALETLAIIAYRQPISKGEIEDIRGVSADGVVNSLLERKLIRIVGRKEVIGRPLLYGTTKEFLHYFGLKDLTDMPELKDLQDVLAADEAGENWELSPEGALVTKLKGKEGDDPGDGSAAGAPDDANENAEGSMQMNAQSLVRDEAAVRAAIAAGGAGEEAAAAGELSAGRKNVDEYDENDYLERQDEEDDEDEDEELEDEEDDEDDDEDDEDDDDEDDEEDDEDEDDEDDEDLDEDDDEDDEDEGPEADGESAPRGRRPTSFYN